MKPKFAVLQSLSARFNIKRQAKCSHSNLLLPPNAVQPLIIKAEHQLQIENKSSPFCRHPHSLSLFLNTTI